MEGRTPGVDTEDGCSLSPLKVFWQDVQDFGRRAWEGPTT